MAFSIAYNQNHHLIGSNGLKPANKHMEKILDNFKSRPMNLVNPMLEKLLSQNFELFLTCPTFFWFFDWSKNIDDLLFYTSIGG